METLVEVDHHEGCKVCARQYFIEALEEEVKSLVKERDQLQKALDLMTLTLIELRTKQ